MKRLLVLVLLALSAPGPAGAQARTAQATTPPARNVNYGANPAAGHTFTHDAVKLYYEVYGAGEPLLLVHGNGGSIGTLSAQIAHFRKRYKVIAMDSRDQGRSGDSRDKITYEKMTDDLAALLDHLKVGPVNVLGWSDGGIEALLLGIRHPAKVKKIAAMASNLNPSENAVHPEMIAVVKSMIEAIPATEKNTPQGRRELKVTGMMLEEPNLDVKALEAITAPTLVLASDHDLIRDEHTIEIYHHIPNSQLAIFPNATHMIPFDDPATFNATVERFFRTPFVKKERINDTLKSFEKLKKTRTEKSKADHSTNGSATPATQTRTDKSEAVLPAGVISDNEDSVQILDVSPAPGSYLHRGEQIVFKMKVVYNLKSADVALLSMSLAQIRESRGCAGLGHLPDSTTVAIKRGRHLLDIALEWSGDSGKKSKGLIDMKGYIRFVPMFWRSLAGGGRGDRIRFFEGYEKVCMRFGP